MQRVLKYVLVIVVTLMCAAVALFEYSSYQDQKQFSEAKNDCERGCIQDSGGLNQCRKICSQHPGHYP